MLRAAVLAILIALVAATPLVSGAATAGATGLTVQSQGTRNQFPNGIQFTVVLTSDTPLDQVRLRYNVQPERLTAFARPDCNEGVTTTCTVVIGSTVASYLVPGAEILYAWEIRNQGGDFVETQEQQVTYRDDRFRWESMSLGNITGYYYGGNTGTIQSILNAARQTIDEVSELLRTEIDFPVKIWVYETTRDLQPAVASGRGLPPGATGGVTLGEVAAPDTALMSRDRLALSVVRHEVAHIVTRKAGRQHLAGIPSWLNEGISVYAQRELSADQEGSLQAAIRGNRVLPIESLSASRTSDVGLFYGQSGAVVTHMIEKYGKDKFADFFHALRDTTMDSALRSVYGFDTLGLENDWRASVRLPAVTSTGGGQGGTERVIPTIVPFGADSPQRDTPREPEQPRQDRQRTGEGGGLNLSLPVVVGGLTTVLAVLILGAGIFVARRAGA
jgi:hypothetical protein